MKFSANFSGSNYLSVANFTGNPAAFSVSCWVYLNTSQTSRIFLSNYNGSSNWAPGISDGSTNQIKFFLGGGNTLTSPTVLSNNTWYHAIFTHDGTTAKIYLNGNTTPNASTVTALGYGAVATNNFIGSLDGSSQKLNGALAALGYWSKALSTAEVTSLYNSGAGLTFADLSGTLLTSLGAYYDFPLANVGLDSSAGAHTMGNTGAVLWSPSGPSGCLVEQPSPYRLPGRIALNSGWPNRMLNALVPGQDSGNIVGVRDIYAQRIQPWTFANAQVAMPRTIGPWGPEVSNAHSPGSGGPYLGQPLSGSTQFTFSSLCLADAFNDLGGLWMEETSTANLRICLSGTAGNMIFQVGSDGAFTNLTAVMPLNKYVLVTCRLAPGGVRSIWMGGYKVAERTDAGIAYGTGSTVGMSWGGSYNLSNRSWSGRLTCGYAWSRSLADDEIVALASDPFAPVRPVGPRAWLAAGSAIWQGKIVSINQAVVAAGYY